MLVQGVYPGGAVVQRDYSVTTVRPKPSLGLGPESGGNVPVTCRSAVNCG